ERAEAERDRLREECAELRGKLETSEAATKAAVQRSQWQAVTNRELNDTNAKLRELEAELAEWRAMGGAAICCQRDGSAIGQGMPALWPNPWRQEIAVVAWALVSAYGEADRLREGLREADAKFLPLYH